MGGLVAAVLGLLSGPAAAEWTTADTAREVTYLGLHVADWGQTLDIAENDDFYETNPVLGKQPSRGEVNRYFALTGLTHVAISAVLPNEATFMSHDWNPRASWQYVSIAVEGSTVYRNYKIGIRIEF